MLGHYLSTTSLAAGPGYKSARIPALTGTSFVNDLTRGNEFYFRAQTTSSLQGRSIAEYLRAVMKEPKVHLVHSRDRFGSSFLQGFAQGYEPGLLSISGLDIDPAGRIGPVTELLDARAGAIRTGRHRHRDGGRLHRRHREGGASGRRQGADHCGGRCRP